MYKLISKIKLPAAILLYGLTVFVSLLMVVLLGFSAVSKPVPAETLPDVSVLDSFDAYLDEIMTAASEAAKSTPKHFWIKDGDPAPVPDQNLFGQADDPKDLQWLLDDAQTLLEGQTTLFTSETEIMKNSMINYYLDDSILAITWKQVFDNFVYTISEVKISDPSQFRRYIADETYNSNRMYLSTQMSRMNNAVVASSADFYRNRKFGTVVYDRQVLRVINPYIQDVCHVDSKGDLIFTYRGELGSFEEMEQFVADHDIVFSLSFGPVLVEDGVRCEPQYYPIGEIDGYYPRAALCQYDELHYLVIAATAEGRYSRYQTIHDLAKHIDSFGCQQAYTLDGGQTANVVMNHELINNINYDYVKPLSDIIYFATAIPNKE